jgi:uncharacterized membrane protein
MTEPGQHSLTPPSARRARNFVLACIAILAACVLLAALGPGARPGNLLLAAGLLLPLALPLPGIARCRRRTYAWATLCVTPYFIYGTTEVVANPQARVAAGAILLASLALFAGLVSFLRLTRPGRTFDQAS